MTLLATRTRTRQLPLGTERRHADVHDGERRRRERQGCSDGGGLTLERQIARVWEGLHADGAASCPMCGGRMSAAGDHGRCGDCGTTLS